MVGIQADIALKLKEIVREVLNKMVPGLYAILNSMSISRYGASLESLLIKAPARVYKLMLEFLSSDIAAEFLMRALLRRLLGSEVEADTILSVIKRGEEIDLESYLGYGNRGSAR